MPLPSPPPPPPPPNGAGARIRLRSVVFDCPEPATLAAFYGALLGEEPVTSDPDWCEVRPEGLGVKLAFQRAIDHRAPEWPDGVPQQVHLDLDVTELEPTTARALALGARQLTGAVDEEEGCTFIVFADPAGHPFCLCRVTG